MALPRNSLNYSSNINIQTISRNPGLNEKEMIICSQIQTLYMPTCELFLKF